MIPQDLPPELTLERFRRWSTALLVVGAITLAAAEAVRPAPVASLAVFAVLGAVMGWLVGNSPFPSPQLPGFWIEFSLLLIAAGVFKDADELGVSGALLDHVADVSIWLIAGMVPQLLRAREIVERRQQWWREHGPALANGLNPNPVSFRERWRFWRQVEARRNGWNWHRNFTLAACLIIMMGAAGLAYGESGYAVILGLGVVFAASGVYGMRVTRRSNG